MGVKPEAVGDVASFRVTFTPPDSLPAAVASGVELLVRKPDGTEADDTAGLTAAGTNVYDYVQSARIDMEGLWTWRVNSNAGIIKSAEKRTSIARSAFTDPLP